MPSNYVFRVFGLTEDVTAKDFRVLGQYLKASNTYKSHDIDNVHAHEQLNVVGLTIVPSCAASPFNTTKSGLLSIQCPLPEFLERLRNDPSQALAFVLRGEDVRLDANFYGFTQMYPTRPGQPIPVDIIAVAGLNGHPYGSWMAKGNLERMWLRDFLAKDFPNCRTMTYGYNANLRSKSVPTIRLSDFCTDFLSALESVRQSEDEIRRPLIFIGHSYGGLLIAHTLVKAKFEQRDSERSIASLIKATCGILFFGTPHRGMLVSDMVMALKTGGHAQRIGILEEIKSSTKALEADFHRFINLCDRFKIFSFVEALQTPSVVVGNDDIWKRIGESSTAVCDTSGLLQLPLALETRKRINADHSGIVKFDTRHDPSYQEVHKAMNELLSMAAEVQPQLLPRACSNERIPHRPSWRDMDFVGRAEALSRDGRTVFTRCLRQVSSTYAYYKTCSQLICDAVRRERGLKGCYKKIAIEERIYVNTWTSLLALLVEKGLAASMVEDGGHAQWMDPTFHKVWTETLGNHFDTGVEIVRDTLTEIERMFFRDLLSVTRTDTGLCAASSWGNRWALSDIEALSSLIDTLRAQNQELKRIQERRARILNARKPKYMESKSPLDLDVVLARLLAIREVSQMLYNSLAGMVACPCHNINLRLHFDVDETPEPPSRPSTRIQHLGDLEPVIQRTKFRMIVTKERVDGSNSQSTNICDCACIVITSELEPEEDKGGGLRLKRRVTVQSMDDARPTKRVRFAEVADMESSSAWSVVTVQGGSNTKEKRILDLEPELETKRIKVTLSGEGCSKRPSGYSTQELVKNSNNSPLIGSATPTISTALPLSIAEIDSLCSLMQKLAPEIPPSQCLGRIKSCDRVRRHLVYRDQPGILRAPRVSLESILDKGTLYRDDRLRISLTLAKSLLHLGSYSKSFFQERWRSRDIYFFQSPHISDPVGDPYVVPIFQKPPQSVADHEAPARSEQLFSLALTLIEIGFGKRLWRIHDRSRIPEKADYFAEFMEAKSIVTLSLLKKEMGVEFSRAVERCLFCDFGIDEHDLCKKELQEIFYTKVVAPLEHALRIHVEG